MSLSTLIVQRDVASIRQVEEALARQVLYGGDLVTNLLEVVQIPEAVLVPLLAETLGLVAGPVGMLPPPSVQARGLVPEEVAAQRRLIPLFVEAERLVVAVGEPLGPGVLEDLSSDLGVRVEQRIAPVVRVREALARVYGVPLDRRMARLVGRLAGVDTTVPNSLPPVSMPRVEVPPLPEALIHDLPQLNPPGLLSLDVMCFSDPDVPADERDAAPSVAAPKMGAPLPESGTPAPSRTLQPLPEAAARRAPATLDHVAEQIAAADDREQVLRLFFDFARHQFDYSALFVVRGDLAEGRDAFGNGAPRERVLAIGVPLDMPSLLRVAREKGEALRVVPQRGGLDAVLMVDLRRDGSSQVLVVPIVVRSRTVAFLVADDGATGVSESVERDVGQVAALAGRQFERILVKAKLQGPGKAASPPTQIARSPHVAPPAHHAGAHQSAMRALGQALALPEQTLVPPPPAALPPPAVRPEPMPARRPQVMRPEPMPVATRPQVTRPAPLPAALPPQVMRPEPQPANRPQVSRPAPMPEAPAAPPPPQPRRINTLIGYPAVTGPPTVRAGSAPPPAEGRAPIGPLSSGPELPSSIDAQWEPADALLEGPRDGRTDPSAPADPATDDGHTPLSAPTFEESEPVRGLYSAFSDGPPPPQTLAVRSLAGPPLPREDQDDVHMTVDERDLQPPAGSSRPPPADLRQARLLRNIEALTAQFVKRDPEVDASLSPPKSQSVTLPPHHPPPSRKLDPLPSVIVDLTAQVERLMETFLGNPKDDQVEAELLRIGQKAMPSIMKHFPGPITIMRATLDDSWPRVVECGPVLRLIAGQRRVALPFVLARTEDPDTETRFWATYLLTELPYPDAISATVARLFDDSKRVRRAARLVAHVLAETAPGELVQELDRIVADPDATTVRRIVTIDALGEMRDPLVVPVLLGALGHDDEDVGTAARRALVLVTRQDFGRDAKKWLAWWRASSGRHRVEWLIDALTHEAPAIRRAAGQELKALTEEYFGYYDDLPRKDRERAQLQYREWWQHEGKSRFKAT